MARLSINITLHERLRLVVVISIALVVVVVVVVVATVTAVVTPATCGDILYKSQAAGGQVTVA